LYTTVYGFDTEPNSPLNDVRKEIVMADILGWIEALLPGVDD
jgi:hypothetical protein